MDHFLNKIKIMKSIEIVMLPVKDQVKAKEYYLKLGFVIVAEAPMGEHKKWLQLAIPGQEVSIALMEVHGVICATESIEEDRKIFANKGIEVGKTDKTPWGSFAWLKDPDGNGICLHEK